MSHNASILPFYNPTMHQICSILLFVINMILITNHQVVSVAKTSGHQLWQIDFFACSKRLQSSTIFIK